MELEPPIKNPMSSLWSLYDRLFYKNLICPQGITYNPSLRAVSGCHTKNVVSGLFNYNKQNGYLKILVGCIWGNDLCGRAGCPLITFHC